MSNFLGVGVNVVSFLIVIAVCVLIHEGGHYFAAIWRGVQVHEFAFGMGPRLFSRRGKSGTIFSVRIFPIGGFVRMEGEEGEDARPEDTPDPERSFQRRKSWERFLIIAGGAFMNIALAWVIMAALLMNFGVDDVKTPRIGQTMEGYPAAQMGARQGDMVLSINGQKIQEWGDIRKTLNELSDDAVTVVVEREGEEITLTGNVPVDAERKVRLWGITPSKERFGVVGALSKSLGYCWTFGVQIVTSLFAMVTGTMPAEVTGPVGIAKYAGWAAQEGFWTFMSFLAVINLNLGLLNLFPFPALDGGRLVFLFGEMVTGRKFPEEWESRIHYVGFALLMALILFVTWKDIVTIFK